MAAIRLFMYVRLVVDKTARVTALPYDVHNREEVCEAVKGSPLPFLNIDRAETQSGDDVDTYNSRVYSKARELLDCRIKGRVYVTDPEENYYLYELIIDDRNQTGIVVCCSIDDYVDGVVKKYENIREDKEPGHTHHVDIANAHTGPIFLAYRQNQGPKALVAQVKEEAPPHDLMPEDAVRHRVWVIGARNTARAVEDAFVAISATYIADGYHRIVFAVKVGLKRREENPDCTGKGSFNYLLSVLFSDEELKILPYNRVVEDLNGLGQEKFLTAVSGRFEVQKRGGTGTGIFGSEKKGIFGMLLKDR